MNLKKECVLDHEKKFNFILFASTILINKMICILFQLVNILEQYSY